MSGTGLSTGDTTVMPTDKNPCPHGAFTTVLTFLPSSDPVTSSPGIFPFLGTAR